jgi:hypothetical protein
VHGVARRVSVLDPQRSQLSPRAAMATILPSVIAIRPEPNTGDVVGNGPYPPIISAARSAIAYTVAGVLADGIDGMADASAPRTPLMR